MKNKVTELTSSNKKGVDGMYDYSVYRANPVATMQRWRHTAGFTTVNVIDNNCHKLYPVLGYRRLHSSRELVGNTSVVLEPDHRYGVF